MKLTSILFISAMLAMALTVAASPAGEGGNKKGMKGKNKSADPMPRGDQTCNFGCHAGYGLACMDHLDNAKAESPSGRGRDLVISEVVDSLTQYDTNHLRDLRVKMISIAPHKNITSLIVIIILRTGDSKDGDEAQSDRHVKVREIAQKARGFIEAKLE
ncbi:hypothetical protein BJ684DRAFT_15590 [Piptocephalis cylindrospora]|uniref:Uncharacterized protein n=1 Tax=Piptocephalis cylindrospora TaxID=1907219 RepID=A0A4P9Y5G9_9FUNG|nr:hypothetical protein BJ684DRAFT_15590 [Piptocephalis cylindrospora]|eukprot:RKP14064.1 hypothetical protein BJ684DRAFT_15590 [Piptocephalis cylindrospora]